MNVESTGPFRRDVALPASKADATTGEASPSTEEETPTTSIEEDVCMALISNQGEWESIKTSGGHGNFFIATVKVGNTNHNLFLKPLDETENTNLKFLHEKATEDLKKFIPHLYGTVEITVKVDGINRNMKYMVLENFRNADNKELVDAKLSAGDIAKQEEVKLTRGKGKTFITFYYQKLAQMTSPGFMISNKEVHRKLRFLFYSMSEKTLAKALVSDPKNAAKSQENLKNLQKELETLRDALKESPMAFIGASVMIYQDKEGAYTVKLIDPAHGQADPRKLIDSAHGQADPRIGGKLHVYRGPRVGMQEEDHNKNIEEFENQLATNVQSVNAMVKAVQRMRNSVTTNSTDQVGISKFRESVRSFSEKFSETLNARAIEPIRNKVTAVKMPSFPSFSSLFHNIAQEAQQLKIKIFP